MHIHQPSCDRSVVFYFRTDGQARPLLAACREVLNGPIHLCTSLTIARVHDGSSVRIGFSFCDCKGGCEAC